jgi:excisionase family DNA binding protein
MTKRTDQTETQRITTADAAKIAQVDYRTVRRWCESGELPAEKQQLGQTFIYLIKPNDLQTFLKTRGQPRKD